jgi:signal transduction histidine kinase
VGRRVVAGDLAAEPAPHPAGDEMTGLSESIRTMLRTLRAHRDELQRASDAAAARATKAERDLLVAQRLASIGTLASGIAHEINNPLGGLTNAMRRLEKGDLPPEKRTEYFALVLDGLERIRGIVGRVLSIAPRAIGPTSVSVAEAARAAVAFVEHRAARESVRIETRLSDSGDAIQGDRGEIVQVFLNLLVNALDAIAARRARDGRGGVVRVEVRRDGAHVSALVEDDGTGMVPAQLHRVFDPFFTTKEPGQGTGLGLTLVYALVRNHGGTIDVRNRDGGGFAALLQIPAAS